MRLRCQIGTVVATAVLLTICSHAQPAPTSTGGNSPSSPGGGTSTPASAGGGGSYSIETEMFAYKALQSDGEAIVCDIARYLSDPQSTASLPPGPNSTSTSDATGFNRVVTGCNLPAVPKAGKGVVIVSSTSTTLANYQLWRTDMVLMKQLLLQAQDLQKPNLTQPQQHAADVAGGFSVASQAVTLIQGVLSLFASSQSYTGLTGTIQDQALVTNVARQLKNLGITVLSPDIYASHAIGGINTDTSPFLKNLTNVINEHTRLQGVLQADQAVVNAALKLQADRITVATDQVKLQQSGLTDPQKQSINDEILRTNAEISSLASQLTGVDIGAIQQSLITCQSVLSAMEVFLANLTGGNMMLAATNGQSTPPSSQPSSSTPSGQGTTTPPQPNGSPQGSQTLSPSSSPVSAPSNGVPPIVTILSADGLAQSIGATGDPSYEPASGWHILSLKALESGGGLTTESNILGSKVYFSGGAVVTYDLFQFNGSLTCSGNVMAYGGFVRAKDFHDKFALSDLDPRKQLIYLRGGCAAEVL